ncbi:NTP transferase domain-containing protein [uncultured Phascolarctobacterium sp.]|uniref:NTP transferase domain-containing protein n=1 Tax=uncultured Phascolarctobacterium sp. TaxID=512296 RepID=UPI0025CC1220|nr:NTP transferase domain-containing protein [uncultured Phascolarctobacterium sp.]
MQQYDAFIAAGGSSPWLQDICGTPYRCLAVIGGRRLIDYITDALLGSGRIHRIVVAAAPEALAQLEGTLPASVSLCPAAPTLSVTACDAVQYFGESCSPKILGVCDDIPLLTAAGVQDFLSQCEAYPNGQVYYPIIPQAACLEQFPHAQRTYGRLRDGAFTGGNMMLIDKAVIPLARVKADEIFALRKSPLRLANWLGWSFIFKALLHRLTIEEAEQRFSKIMDMTSKAVITSHAGIGMDIDKPADLRLAGKYLAK